MKPKQSLGQNYLQDGNTIDKIVKSFDSDLTLRSSPAFHVVELGPGLGSLTTPLIKKYGTADFTCIEIDSRAVAHLRAEHPVSTGLKIIEADVMQVDYGDFLTSLWSDDFAADKPSSLSVVGNLPYYITSQILFALCDANHQNHHPNQPKPKPNAINFIPPTISTCTVTMQYEVALRMVAPPSCGKDRGILSVVFELYAEHVKLHFKIPPTVFYPVPKVTSALVGVKFCSFDELTARLDGVRAEDFRAVVTTSFRQRRKCVRNSLKSLILENCGVDATQNPIADSKKLAGRKLEGNKFAQTQILPPNWPEMRPEEFSAAQFVELTRLIFQNKGSGTGEELQKKKVWRKQKHGVN
ncbi:hypothetical protein ScalyP_jg2341 [Parmales sp. scaly parma]|nr:hypothetical protein ScalyP_jg2341 [Parmales sp. scaly parma]